MLIYHCLCPEGLSPSLPGDALMPQLEPPSLHNSQASVIGQAWVMRFDQGQSEPFPGISALETGVSRLLPWGFLGGLDGKETAWNAGEPALIPGSGRSLQEEMATHSSILAWRIPWTEEPGGLQSVESQRVGHDLVTNTHTCTHAHTHTHTHRAI